MSEKTWFIYLLECADGSWYTGIAIDVAARLEAHQTGKGARYTRSHKPLRLLASAPIGPRSQALKAELAIKRLPKAQKLPAIQSLAAQITHPPGRSSPMNNSELIAAIAQSAELSKADAARALMPGGNCGYRNLAERAHGVTSFGNDYVLRGARQRSLQ